MTSVAGGCMPICHGLGSAASATAVRAAMSITPSASIKSALAVVFIVNKLVNRTMRLRPLIRYGQSA